MSDTIVWISGATQGLGLGLARQVPWAEAKVINISRRIHPDYETLRADLSDPVSWDAVADHFATRLAAFRGERAIFVHNAYVPVNGAVGTVDPVAYRNAVIANCAAPLVLAEAFVRACRPDFESGLVLLSSDSAIFAFPTLAAYCAAKVSVEHWAEVVRRERQAAGAGPWVVAVRPGTVLTPPVEATAALDESVYPGVLRMREKIAATGVTIDEAGRRIWAALPPPPGISVISFGEHPSPERDFGGERVLMKRPR